MIPPMMPLLLAALLGVGAQAAPAKTKPAPPWRETMDSFKKPSPEELRRTLTPLQYEVTQEEGTEPPFKNEYNGEKREGIYVDRVSGEPLFSSKEKYESGTGWPSFYKPLVSSNIVTKEDRSFFSKRVEVRSRHADSHLGHVFEDGPQPTGLRYCMNSAALRFIPKEELEAQGYGEFKTLFDKPKKTETATLAGGCFWGMEEILRTVPGVVATKVGYTGGTTPKPTYEQVKTGRTGHAESIEVVFDPTKLPYEELLEKWFFKMHDPTTKDRQGNDAGSQYRSAIFFHSDVQRQVAEKVKEKVDKSGKWKRPIVTQIAPASEFTPAEEYHQKYLVKNPGGYTCHFLRE